MLSIAAFSDIHAMFNNIRAMRKQLADIDVVVLAGDMTNGRMKSLHRLLEYITPYNENIVAVCGNHDTKEMEKFLSEKGMSLHARHKIIDDVAFIGCSGSLPFIGGNVFTEDEYKAILSKSITGLSSDIPKILVAHQPPHKTRLDRTFMGLHVGSKSIREFIEKEQPLICFTGHIHEAFGLDSIGKTRIINPGMIEGTNRYAYAEIDNGIVTTLELRQANPQG